MNVAAVRAKRIRGFTNEQFWYLVGVLAKRTLKVRYRGSFLGVYWSLLNPLAMTALYTVVFSRIFKSYYDSSQTLYAMSVFVGLTMVSSFAGSTGQALTSLVANGALLNKQRLPMAAFPISMVAAWAFQFAVGVLPVFVAFTILLTHDPLRIGLLTVPLAGLALLSVGVSFFVSALYVFYRDIPYMYELVIFSMWIATPVFYPAAIIPQRAREIIEANPLFSIIESTRQIVLGPHLPALPLLFASLWPGVVLAALGYGAFQALRGRFMDLI